MKNDLRGSGSKENVGRKENNYTSKRVAKIVPEPVHGLCNALIDQTVDSWKLIQSMQDDSEYNNVEHTISDCHTEIRGFCGDKFFAIEIKNGVRNVLPVTECKNEINKKL